MCVCMYAYVYVCMYICMVLRTYICMYICMHACMHACIYTYMYKCNRGHDQVHGHSQHAHGTDTAAEPSHGQGRHNLQIGTVAVYHDRVLDERKLNL